MKIENLTDLPLMGKLILDAKHLKLFKSSTEELTLLIEDTELFDYLDDCLIEKTNIKINHYQQINVNSLILYLIFFDNDQEEKLIEFINSLDTNEINKIWSLNNKKPDVE